MTAYNTCSPINTFGPPEQTLFLGCSISDFSVNIGWNEQVGELTVKVVEDTCSVPEGAPPKVYYDHTLTRQTTTGPDPGFIEPNIGSACYFRVGDFEWSGLVQSWEENNSIQGKPTYTIKLVDARQVLEGSQLIIGNYAGSVELMPNIVNVYGFAESFGTPAPLNVVNGAPFGSPAGGFGGSLSNDNGMPWYIIQACVSMLLSSPTPLVNMWSPHGRLLFRDSYGTTASLNNGLASETIGYGIIPGDGFGSSAYLVDLSDMPAAPYYWKIAGSNVSILEAISQICQDAVCDYYLELLPTKYSGQILKVIKVRTVNRAVQPSLDQIENFIAATPAAIQSSRGLEMRNETVAAFVVGGKIQSIYQAANDVVNGNDSDTICPFFGTDPFTGNIYEPFTDDNGDWCVRVNLVPLNMQMVEPLGINVALVTEMELRAALGGRDTWMQMNQMLAQLGIPPGAFEADIPKALKNRIDAIENAPLLAIYAAHPKLKNFIPPVIDFHNMKSPTGKKFLEGINAQDKDKVYEFVLSLARDFYGKKFMVRVPYTIAARDGESGLIQTTENPSDGGWTDATDVIGLPNQSAYTDFFTLQDDRLGCFVGMRQPNSTNSLTIIDYTNAHASDVLVTQNENTGEDWVYIRAQAEPGFVYVDTSTGYSPRVVVTIGQAVLEKDTTKFRDELNAYISILENSPKKSDAALLAKAKRLLAKTGGPAFWYPWGPKASMINGAAIPIRSTVSTYGPWYMSAANGIIKFEEDDGLVPWEYGGTDSMRLAGISKAFNGTASAMQVGEMGAVEVPGYPVIPLGAELGAYNAGYFGGGFHLFETRSLSVSNFNVDGGPNGDHAHVTVGPWTGIYGPNITSIGVNYGLGGVTTNYGMRTFTPSWGRFSRGNAERLKRRGRDVLKSQKMFRLVQFNLARLGTMAGKQGAQLEQQALDKRVAHSIRDKKGRWAAANTPHEFLVGSIYDWSDNTSRAMIVTEEFGDTVKELDDDDYSGKAIMSLDALLRPVSMYGDGGLPRFIIPLSGNYLTISAGAMPPFGTGVIPTGQYSANISQKYLNPFASGHDISILAYGDTAPSGTDSLNMYVNAGTSQEDMKYQDDYRFMALRGPIIIQQWGYDLNGKPVPNAADDETNATDGTFVTDNLKDRFLDNWMTKSHTWPVAPLDVRLDRKRGVWVSPPEYRMQLVKMNQNCWAGGTGLASFVNLPALGLYDASGNAILPTQTCITVQDITKCHSMPSGQQALVYYEPDIGRYFGLPLGNRVVMASLQSTLSATGSAFANVMSISGNSYSNTGETIKVFDFLMKSGKSIPANTRIICFEAPYVSGSVSSGVFILQEAACSS